MLAYHLRKIVAKQFVSGCYPMIVEGNLFYYVKLKYDTLHESDDLINPLRSGKEKNKQNRKGKFNQTCTRKSQNIFQSQSE